MKTKLLIVEDSPTQAEQLKFLLEKHNYKTLVAKDGKEALEMVIEHKPSLVISDILMPEIHGFELCRMIKEDSRTKDIPVILLSFLMHIEDVLNGLNCGADSFINKPYSESFLISHIENTLQGNKLNQGNHRKINLNISITGKTHFISADPVRIVSLLIAAYESAISKKTELIQTQNELSSLNSQLEDIVSERTAELSRINAEKDKFFSIIAHDLRSPLSGLIGLTELMAKNALTFPPDELVDISLRLYNSSTNLGQLLENLLEWAELQKDSVVFSPQQLNLSPLVVQNIRVMEERALQKRISIVNEVREDQYVFADEKMIGTILRNLLSNAVKYTKSGGSVAVRSKNTDNEMMEISVSDSGVGMDEDLIKKLFRINEKVGSEGTDGEPSTGLGLILCKEFVEKHGGKIWIKSNLNRGSIFTFTLKKGIYEEKVNEVLLIKNQSDRFEKMKENGYEN